MKVSFKKIGAQRGKLFSNTEENDMTPISPSLNAVMLLIGVVVEAGAG